MRWIDTSNYSPPEKWITRATKVTEELKRASSEEQRKKIISSNSSLWAELKEDLLKLSHNKCWYTEAKKTISNFDVDHFRPKGNVKNFVSPLNIPTINNDGGYWWLAFDWKNYRPCGEIPNRKLRDQENICRGKQDYFPLVDGYQVADNPDFNLSLEKPYLLDPTKFSDTILLSFDSFGLPISTVPKGTIEYLKVQVTIHILYLDLPYLVDARLELWNRCERLLNNYTKLIKERDCTSVVYDEQLINIINELRELKNEKQEFSSTVKACLNQSKYPIAREILSI